MLVAGMKMGEQRAQQQAQAQAQQQAAVEQARAEGAASAQQQAAAPKAAAPPAAAAPSSNVNAELQKLVDLHKQGVLTDEEFAAAKKKVLGI
jgi:hypothetical protein